MQKNHAFNIHGAFMNLLSATSGKILAGFFLFFLLPLCLPAQQKTKIILQSSERSRIITKTDITYLRKPVFKQDNAILTCDSAVFYTAKNYFEAYNNVHINQADTINIYSDFLTYDGNAKLAHLTSNVRLVDKSSVLTTNVLDYSMVPKVGTYVDGGKIVNKDATITSKNGFYFANTRDAYFRYNVLVVTEQSTIKSDTLRYNTFSNWAYFYGPTNIKEKDGGNLYTENGAYNTKTRYAYFGKNNLYTSGSRSMKGDSLYYDGLAGYGRAVRNITFRDTVDKMLMRGQLGYYYKADQRTVVTKNAYAGMGTNDSVMVKNAKQKEVKQPDSLWLGADTLETQMVLQKSLKLIKGPAIKKDNELGEEDRESKMNGVTKKSAAPTKKTGAPAPAGNKPGGQKPGEQKPDDKKKPPAGIKPPDVAKDSLKTDSLAKIKAPPRKADSLAKAGNALIKNTDSASKVRAPLSKKDSSALKVSGLKKDSLKADSLKLPPGMKRAETKPTAKLQLGVKTPVVKDSLPLNPLDTVRTRIIKAYRHVNVFKSNMQAKADSLFYTSADSTLRWYRNPIIWSQGSQQTGDTIYLQLRNKKINSVQVIQSAFAVNVDPIDTTKFNQIKGKMITGFFKDGKLSSMYVDGNAESVYFTKTDDGKKYEKMNQTVSSRIKIVFRNSEIGDVVPIKNVEGATTPVVDLKQDVILTGFIWKPELRPRSKRDVTNPRIVAKPKKPVVVKAPAKGVAQAKGLLKEASGNSKIGDLKKLAAKEAMKQLGSNPSAISPSAISKQIGTIKQLGKAADSLKLKDSIPAKLIDTTKKALPGLIKKADSLSKLPVPLKKQ
ncbi:OstA-like protein [Pedobacter westerhofensis]|uniref:OstA-like protein n=2 Tax=Pedobacter westerhofensis TaxID=425512 RepID=A0A521DHM5_9SPHI|nr:OstA-like protein [Pedobacter westerhofensis]